MLPPPDAGRQTRRLGTLWIIGRYSRGVPRLITERLILRPPVDTDLPVLAALNADSEVMRWIGDGSTRDLATTRAELDGYRAGWRDRGFGRFVAQSRAGGAPVGVIGLGEPTDVPELVPCVEIGWRLARASWGAGLATEAARAVLRFAFDDAGLDRLVAISVLGNDASERVMRRIGMRPVLDTVEIVYGRPVRVHEIRTSTREAVRWPSGESCHSSCRP